MADNTYEYDPDFFFPDVEGYSVKDIGDEENSVLDLDVVSDDESDLVESGVGDINDLPTPENITIVSQTIRTSPDGSKVVDVVLSVDDMDEEVQFDVRLAIA